MPFYVYILKCRDNSFYIGHTDDIERRMSEHMNGKYSGYTSLRLPVSLKFTQKFGTREEALCAESKLKKWTRAKKELLISGGWKSLINRKKK
ncbi:MAG: GIY-YIG nuclease family protein [Candidatus Babeliaceae bacterium]|nr:GIY-YIG nuclease family protein [Candidatus Babeliaceae bacterium]